GAPASGASGSTPNASGAAAGTGSTTTNVNFNLGVQGDPSRVVLYVSRVPREFDNPNAQNSDGITPSGVCDLRRITYWLVQGNNGPLGLARQEVKLITSDDLIGSIPPDVPDEASYVIGEEVKGLT